MIIRFGVGNYKSLRSYNELSFVASRLSGDRNGLIKVEGLPDPILPSVAVYGPNASGKSNLIAALDWMRRAIRRSHTEAAENAGVPRSPFRLDETARLDDSKFDIDFVHNGVRYHYGFVCDDKRYKSEWLYAYPKHKRQIWFIRDEEGIDFGSNLPGRNKFLSEQMRPNALFLSTAHAANHEKLSEVAQFFQKKMRFGTEDDPKHFESLISFDATKKLTMALLSSADFGISAAKLEAVDPEALDSDMVKEFKEVMKRHLPGFDYAEATTEVVLGHDTANGSVVYLKRHDESTGTIKLLELIVPVLKCLASGSIMVVDEIDSSLHSAISNNIIKLFSNPNININNSQLLFSTHDTNLLCGGELRRDQIWFAEKDRGGCTAIYPLTDIATRKSDNLERGYLQGRYGAIPFMGDWERLLEDAINVGTLADELKQ